MVNHPQTLWEAQNKKWSLPNQQMSLKNVIEKYFAAMATKKEKISCPNVQITL